MLSSPRRRTVVTHALAALIVGWTACAGVYAARFWSEIPALDASVFSLPQTIMVTDRNGRELIRFHEGHDVVELAPADIPDHLRQAFVTLEDKRFWNRPCVDFHGLARAGTAYLLHERVEGASTITQQLVGLLLENRTERTIRRKVNEILLACRLEWSLPREEILTLYLNRVPFGGDVYGVEQASRTFFGVHARDLSVAQAAVLAALPQRPTSLSPYGGNRFSRVGPEAEMLIREGKATSATQLPEDSWTMGLIGIRIPALSGSTFLVPGRADLALERLRDEGTITAAAERKGSDELRRLRFKDPAPREPDAPYFVRQMREELPRLLRSTPELRERQWSGLEVRTTLDRDLQRLAENTIAKYADAFRTRFGAANISLVAIDRRTREILAYVGNVEADVPGGDYDMASIPRQPGSSFKPFVYAAAFEEGKLSPDSRILDGPLQLGDAKPRNYEGGFWGWMRVKNALAASRNIPAIRAFLIAGGEDVVLRVAAEAGIHTPLLTRTEERDERADFTFGWPLAIGAAEIPLREMVQGYATIANDGAMLPLTSVSAIAQAKDGRSLLALPDPDPVQGMQPEAARELKDILKNESLRPAGGWRKMLDTGDVETAAKTGTSNQCRGIDVRTGLCSVRLPSDTWTMGFSPSLVVGVWAGNATFAALSPQADGLDVAAPIWREFMIGAHELHPDYPHAFAETDSPKPMPVPGTTAISAR